MRTQRRLSDREREERRERGRERLKHAAEQLLTSEGSQRWVRVRAQGGLARLSLSNQLLVALSCPDATFVAGFRAWLDLGHCVRKGEKAIRIIAPMPIKPREKRDRKVEDPTRVLFKVVSVFDRSQVVPIDGGTGGWCDQKARRIVVDAGQPANARLRILIHDTIQALGVGYAEYGRGRAEVIVDTATDLAAASVGLDLSGESVPYRAGWAAADLARALVARDPFAPRVATGSTASA